MLKITPAQLPDALLIQQLFNSKDVIGLLGGFCILDNVKQKCGRTPPSAFVAYMDETFCGAILIAGRPQCQEGKLGEVAVYPEFRRKRVATALYAACIFQGIREGRRLWTDTIVGNNPAQHFVLPTLGLERWGILKEKTASFLDIHIYGTNVTLKSTQGLLARIPQDASITTTTSYYTIDLVVKNAEIWNKKRPTYNQEWESCVKELSGDQRNLIELGLQEPERGGGRKQKAIFTEQDSA